MRPLKDSHCLRHTIELAPMTVSSSHVAKKHPASTLGLHVKRQVRANKRAVLGRYQQGKTEKPSGAEFSNMLSNGTYYISCWMTTAQIEAMKTKNVMFSDLQ